MLWAWTHCSVLECECELSPMGSCVWEVLLGKTAEPPGWRASWRKWVSGVVPWSFSDWASLPVHGCNGIIGLLLFLCLSYYSGLCALKLWATVNESFHKQLPILGDRNKKGTPTLQQLSLATTAGTPVDGMQTNRCAAVFMTVCGGPDWHACRLWFVLE